MDPRRVVEEIERLRRSAGRDSPVEYVDAFEVERPFNRIIFIVVATRADLGAVVAGGRIKQLYSKVGRVIRVISEDELIVRRYRLEKARRRVTPILPRADVFFDAFREYPRVDREALRNSVDASVTVAYSGGADSKASARLLKYAGAKVERLYVKMPKPISIRIPPEARIVEAPPEAERVVRDALEGKYHPCGRCSRIIEETALRNASNDVVVFGHLLPTGVASLRFSMNKIIRSFPASLALSKSDTVYFATEGTMEYEYRFGCMLLHQLHKKYKWMQKPSIRRVIRETVAGVLLPSQSYEYIISIIT